MHCKIEGIFHRILYLWISVRIQFLIYSFYSINIKTSIENSKKKNYTEQKERLDIRFESPYNSKLEIRRNKSVLFLPFLTELNSFFLLKKIFNFTRLIRRAMILAALSNLLYKFYIFLLPLSMYSVEFLENCNIICYI